MIPSRNAKPRRPVKVITYTPRPRATACVMEGAVARATVPLPKNPPVRDESYRRLVAALPCANCGIEGHSQAAHPNTGKGLSLKAGDNLCFPLCADRPGVRGCHTWFDQHALYTRQERRLIEVEWVQQTKRMTGRAA